jgi:chitinase
MRSWRSVALVGGLLVVWAWAPTPSGATFTTRTTSTASVSAASDWTAPTVSVSAPATSFGTVTVTATASDARSGLSSVRLEYAATGASTWTTLCTKVTSPASCSWDTTLLSDGGYQLRAVATDVAGNVGTSTVVGTTVVNTLAVTLTDPGSPLRGTIPLTATLTNPANRTVTSFRLESSVADAASWTSITGCSPATATISCSWTPTSGDYDLRAVAVVSGTTYTDLLQDVTVDNIAPSVNLTNLANTLSGVVSVAATASDAETGIDGVDLQYAVNGTTSWTSICVSSAAPYTCRFDTTKVSDGSYDFRAVATDNAGNTTTSGVQKKVTVNNSIASVSVDSPGTYVSGSVALSANANSSNGVASVVVQYAAHSGGTWTTICTDSSSPYGCTWDTTTLSSGAFDLRAILTDSKGIQLTSATISTSVDNSTLRARDIETVNGSGNPGKVDSGDQVAFGYTSLVAPASLLTGWDGTARTVTVRLQDGQLVSGGATDDTLTVDGVNLGSVDLHGNYVKKRRTVTVSAVMVAGTTVVAGTSTTTITLTLGSTSMGMPTATGTGTMVWTPSVLAKAPAGSACSAAPVSELGILDRDF